MKFTKNEGKKALAIYQEWLAAGVPQDITKYEAFNLTDGLVGDPYGKNHSYSGVRLIDVAVKFVKKSKVKK
jgi:hypothetical protein